jgi:hypothetical protein
MKTTRKPILSRRQLAEQFVGQTLTGVLAECPDGHGGALTLVFSGGAGLQLDGPARLCACSSADLRAELARRCRQLQQATTDLTTYQALLQALPPADPPSPATPELPAAPDPAANLPEAPDEELDP